METSIWDRFNESNLTIFSALIITKGCFLIFKEPYNHLQTQIKLPSPLRPQNVIGSAKAIWPCHVLLQPHQKLAYHWHHYKTFTKHKFLLLHNKVWFKWTLQNLSIFGNFAVPKCLGISKRLNDRSPKLLQKIYFYFYTIKFDSNELYKSRKFFAILPSPKA